jgi:20S proteasome alpha/beta subunit
MTPAQIMTPRGYWRKAPSRQECRDVTVCIAAACRDEDDEEKIVLCTDKKLSSLMGSAETGYKILYLAAHWRLLTAGDEPDILSLYRLYRERFKDGQNYIATKIDESVKFPIQQRKRQLSDE